MNRPHEVQYSHQLDYSSSRRYMQFNGAQTYMPFSRRRDRVMSVIEAHGFPFSRKLSASKSCVNALAFSTGDARWLASGGDDLEIFLWDVHQDDLTKPTLSLSGHRGNIFCVEFSANNRFIYSGGIDDLVIQHDITQLQSPLEQHFVGRSDARVLRYHDDNIRGISSHPYRDECFLSASSDGRIIRHDTRIPLPPPSHAHAKVTDTLQLTHEATDVKYHPTTENLFVTSDSYGNVCLRDMRMAFGGYRDRSNQGGVVLNYATRLTRRIYSRLDLCHPEVSSVAFDGEGEKLSVTYLNYFPTIYGLSDPYPVATCSSQNLPEGQPAKKANGKYTNACTIKHGAFGAAGHSTDQFYAAGSEDFRGYVWKIPTMSELQQRRIEIEPTKWETEDWPPNTTAFTASSASTSPIQCVIPTPLNTPFCRLTGHRSIVNAALIHPHLPCVVTCGVEKDVRLHSAVSSAPAAGEEGMQRTSTWVRKVGGGLEGEEDDRERETRDREIYLAALTGLGPVEHDSEANGSADGERMTISMFDHIIRQEGDEDVFELRRCSVTEDSSDEESDAGGDADMDLDSSDEEAY